MTDRELIAWIARSPGEKAGYKQLVRELGLGGGRERRELLEQLTRLTARGDLIQLDREHWSIPKRAAARSGRSADLIAGRLDLHRDGYGFVRPNRISGAGRAGQQVEGDIFIPPDEIAGAMQGDQVLVELAPPRADGRRYGRIARVLERRNATVVGIFHYTRSDRTLGHTVIPFDERFTQPIVIPRGAEIPTSQPAIREGPVTGHDFSRAEPGPETSGALAPAETVLNPHRVLDSRFRASTQHDDLEGLVVDVEITAWPTATRPPMGRVIEVLGASDDFGVDVEMMIRKHQLPRIFPDAVLAEARRVAILDLGELARRRDFRGLPIVTIDGETARDFDDAVLVSERADGGYELQVHIADVAEYVRAGSDLDLEARLRGTSVYFPDRAIPMLPRELSTDICSLRPNEDRLVLSCILELDRDGRIESYKICEGVIRSAERMTYTDVHAILEGDAETRARYAPLVAHFERMKRLAVLMNQRREERGSIDFDLPEPMIEFDEQGQMRGVTRAERTWANRLIEEFMLAANECVAAWLEDLGVPSLYRIHEKPEPRRVVEFEELAASFGYSLGLGALPVRRIQTRGDRREAQRGGRAARTHEVAEDIAVTPRMYQKLAARIEGKPEERILSYLMLRSLKQARYSEVNEGHFALAAPSYTHFTSPIRRYPDLIVHRITKALLRAGVSGKFTVAEGRLGSPWSHPHDMGLVPPFRKERERMGHGDGGLPPFRKERERTGHGDGGLPPFRKEGEWMGHGDGGLPPFRKERERMGHGDDSELTGNADPSPSSASRTPLRMTNLPDEPPISEAELAQIAEETSQTERRAAEAERELVEWKKVRFMEDKVGDEFAALVLNPTKYGLFIELTDLFVEGLAPIDSLRGDRYTWRENTHEIVGERWGRRFRAGDRVQVILDRILAQERKLQFSIVEEGIVLAGKKPSPPSLKPKKNKRKPDVTFAQKRLKGRKKTGKKDKRR